jgi:hypothetical protein
MDLVSDIGRDAFVSIHPSQPVPDVLPDASIMDAFDASAGATWTVAIILCLAGGGVNLSGMRWAEDI